MNSLAPHDLEKMVWTCPCCKQQRNDKYIRVKSYDVSGIFDLETGSMYINCKYCVDMPGCVEKAADRAWVVKHFLGKFIANEV